MLSALYSVTVNVVRYESVTPTKPQTGLRVCALWEVSINATRALWAGISWGVRCAVSGVGVG